MEKISDLRFIVPPTLFLFLIFFVNPVWFLHCLRCFSEIGNNAILNGLFGIAGLLTLGFIVSSITHFLVIVFKLTATYPSKDIALQDALKQHFVDRNKNYLDFGKDNLENCELASWIMADRAGEYIRSQIDTRWSMAMTNFNCFIASFLALFFCLASPLLILVLILLCIFGYNGWRNLKSVQMMDRILVFDYFRTIKKVSKN